MAPPRALALILVATGLAAALDAWWRMPLGAPHAPGPGLLPLALGLILAALGGAAVVQHAPAPDESIARRRVALVAALLVLYPLLLTRVGFGVTTALVLFALGRAIAPLALARLAVFALAATVVAVVLFRQLLAVPLPVGPWGF